MRNQIKVCALLFGIGLIACGPVENKNCQTITKLVEQKVILTSGYNVETKEDVTLDTLTGKTIEPCKPQKKNGAAYGKATHSGNSNECKTQIVDESDSLRQAVKLSKTPINGTILKDGKRIPAKFHVAVTAVYKSSYCTTKYSAGEQIERCISEENLCKAIKSISPGNIPASCNKFFQ